MLKRVITQKNLRAKARGWPGFFNYGLKAVVGGYHLLVPEGLSLCKVTIVIVVMGKDYICNPADCR